MTCGAQCRARGVHSDAARRISDSATLAWVGGGWDNSVGKWIAFALADGRTDHVLYDSKGECVRHQSDEFRFVYLKLHPGGMSPCEAEIMLDFHRKAYDAGFRLADPDKKNGGPDIIPRIGTADIFAQLRALRKAGG